MPNYCIKLITVILSVITISSCSDPKADLAEKKEAAEAKIESLQVEKKQIASNLRNLDHEQKMLVMEAKKIQRNQESSELAMALQGGLGMYTGNTPSVGDAFNFVNSQQDAANDVKMLKVKFDKLGEERTLLQAREREVAGEISKYKKLIQVLTKRMISLGG